MKNSDEPRWTTADGRKLLYSELEDDHLKNIIKDGYRNQHIVIEAKRRGFEVPNRPVDSLSFADHILYQESFASTALSGNEFAQTMVDLYKSNKATYFLMLNKVLENKKREDT
jgi:hypothetical protein